MNTKVRLQRELVSYLSAQKREVSDRRDRTQERQERLELARLGKLDETRIFEIAGAVLQLANSAWSLTEGSQALTENPGANEPAQKRAQDTELRSPTKPENLVRIGNLELKQENLQKLGTGAAFKGAPKLLHAITKALKDSARADAQATNESRRMDETYEKNAQSRKRDAEKSIQQFMQQDQGRGAFV